MPKNYCFKAFLLHNNLIKKVYFFQDFDIFSKMKKILTTILSLLFLFNVNSFANETLSIEKQLVGIVGAISGTVKTETRELKTGDKIYLNETIFAGAESGTQLLLLDQSTFTIGSDSEVVMDTFIYDPATNDGKIVASVKQGSLKVISGLISKKIQIA